MSRPKGTKNKIKATEPVAEPATETVTGPVADSVADLSNETQIPQAEETKKIICGHEEIVHSPICHVCHEGKAFCGLRWNRCGAHAEHVEADCAKLCV